MQFLRRESRSASVEELAIDSKLIGWAYHSDCQEILLNSVSSNEPTWQEMRSLGVGIWFTNTTQLRIRVIYLVILYIGIQNQSDSIIIMCFAFTFCEN